MDERTNNTPKMRNEMNSFDVGIVIWILLVIGSFWFLGKAFTTSSPDPGDVYVWNYKAENPFKDRDFNDTIKIIDCKNGYVLLERSSGKRESYKTGFFEWYFKMYRKI